MKPGTIPRVELARRITDLPPYRIGQWVLAGTPTTEPYPCTCRYDPCRYERCPDRYRTEGDALPPACCGRRSPVAGKTPEGALEYWVGVGGFPSPGKPSEKTLTTPAAGSVRSDRRTSWERRLPTTPGAGVADSDLWGDASKDAPPDWDAIDEASGSHGETLEDAFGHLETLDPIRGAEEDAEERWRAENAQRRAGVAAGHCECPTPWDTDPPSLLWTAGPKATAPERVQELSAKPGADVRADADTAIELAGGRRLKPWRKARHALLPLPDARTKTRECWTAPLDTGGVAVIDLPPEPRGGGTHCPDCHNHFQSSGAYEMHRPKSPGHPAGVCRPPASVRLVMPGSTPDAVTWGPPLLKQDLRGVWSVDTKAVWGPDGPPPEPTAGWSGGGGLRRT